MSNVAGVMLMVCVVDRELVEPIQQYLEEQELGRLLSLDEHTGGGKHPQYAAFGSGYREGYFVGEVLETLLEMINSITWNSPECVLLIVKPEDGGTVVHRPTGWERFA